MSTKITMKAARVNAGLTLKEASQKIGVTLQTLACWESGKTSPTIKKAFKLCEVYDININDLFLQ